MVQVSQQTPIVAGRQRSLPMQQLREKQRVAKAAGQLSVYVWSPQRQFGSNTLVIQPAAFILKPHQRLWEFDWARFTIKKKYKAYPQFS